MSKLAPPLLISVPTQVFKKDKTIEDLKDEINKLKNIVEHSQLLEITGPTRGLGSSPVYACGSLVEKRNLSPDHWIIKIKDPCGKVGGIPLNMLNEIQVALGGFTLARFGGAPNQAMGISFPNHLNDAEGGGNTSHPLCFSFSRGSNSEIAIIGVVGPMERDEYVTFRRDTNSQQILQDLLVLYDREPCRTFKVIGVGFTKKSSK